MDADYTDSAGNKAGWVGLVSGFISAYYTLPASCQNAQLGLSYATHRSFSQSHV